ncbi:MAG TPA: hypothetical protein VGF90_01950, partial [Verrucomicrobiae bacterium]
MRDRPAQILKLICIGLAALLVVQLVKVARRANPLAQVSMPEVPSLPADTNAPPAVAAKPPGKPGTNAIAAANETNAIAAANNGTNSPAIAADTNAAPHKRVRSTNATELVAASASTNLPAASNITVTTNLVLNLPTNAAVTIVAETSAAPVLAVTASNSAPAAGISAAVTNSSGTNLTIALPTNATISGTNIALAKISGGTNLAGAARTNSTNSARAPGGRSAAAMAAAMMGGPGGKKPAALPPEIQARVDRVYESEIFAPVNHPVPMALLGIAGQTAFLRAPSGQTGLVKEGEELGEIKLL